MIRDGITDCGKQGNDPLILARISVRGIVQGVGFRPFVYRIAAAHDLKGWVCNTSREVMIEVEGGEGEIRRFLDELRSQAPPRSRIEEVTCVYGEPMGYESFEIRESSSREGQYQLISPDIATCPDCEKELLDSRDRRYLYPFINCTNCGPRLTIIEDIPYDRPKTTMRPFRMCPECRKEYDDPLNRRFHAQPNCCSTCGPKLTLADNERRPVPCTDPIEETARLLKTGKIVAMKGLGGFLLACDATAEQSVRLLRKRKGRSSKPFAVMMGGMEEIKRYCHVSAEEEALLSSPQSPIVLLKLKAGVHIFSEVSPHLDTLGAMLPYTPLHHVLMRAVGRPLVMTSGNLSEEPIVGDNREAFRKLGHIADYFLLHDRDIYALCDDSVTLVEGGRPQIVRRARGYAPRPVRLSFDAQQVLACGGQMKNTFCMTKDRYAFLSQHIGDMDNLETLGHFEKMLDLYKRLFRLNPGIVAHDKHPDYLSTVLAGELCRKEPSLRRVTVQHHHAHVVSCMVENHTEEPVIGVAFDGTGYGDDGAVWGGEFLISDYRGFSRLAHIEYVPLPGGEAAIRRPCRMAASYLITLLGEEVLDRGVDLFTRMDPLELDLLKTQIQKGINSPLTSSAGRLFDGVSALIGIRDEIEYEGQAAIELEMAGHEVGTPERLYPIELKERNGRIEVGLRGLFTGLLEDLEYAVSKADISARFHHTMAETIATLCRKLAGSTGIDLVALSGGVFQNRRLLGLTCASLEKKGLKVLTHGEIPCNDGGISLGQAVAAHWACKDP